MADFFGAIVSFFAGHIFLLILLIILVLILLLIFYPIKYDLRGKYDESFFFKGKFWWLFSIYGFDIRIAEKTRVWFHLGPIKRMIYGEKKSSSDTEKENDHKKNQKIDKKNKDESEDEEEEDEDDKKTNSLVAFINFIKKKENRDYLKKVFELLKKTIKKMLPRSIKANVRFGLGAPEKTGLALAAISAVPMAYWYDISIVPDFEVEDMYVKATFHMVGKIKIAWILAFLISNLVKKQTIKIIRFLLGSKNIK